MSLLLAPADFPAYLRAGHGAGADLRGADLRGANLRFANLFKADLSWADLREADLRGANLREANLRYANLREADLFKADLRGAYLFKANLRGAYLRYADLSWADLRWADLREADLYKADLSGADLRHADLNGADLRGAKYDPTTIWSDGFNPTTANCAEVNSLNDVLNDVACPELPTHPITIVIDDSPYFRASCTCPHEALGAKRPCATKIDDVPQNECYIESWLEALSADELLAGDGPLSFTIDMEYETDEGGGPQLFLPKCDLGNFNNDGSQK